MLECVSMWKLVTSVVFAFLLVSLKPVVGQDRTRQIGQSGTDLVVSVVDQIRQSGIFPNDYDLLPRIAYVASMNGMDPDTYRAGFNGGIWQITNVQFAQTQNVASIPLITGKLNAIQQFYGITWQTLSWDDLRRPLHSGLAAMLLACIVEDGMDNTAIPQSIADQANYWKQFFDTIPANTPQTFMAAVASLPNLTPDPNCPSNQRASTSSLQEYATLSWTPPPNVIAERSSFRGSTNINMAPGTSYMFENVYTDDQGNERTCAFTGSVSFPANGGPSITYCPSNIYLMAPPGANFMTVSWATPRAAMPIVRRNRHPDETSIFQLGHNLVEYFFEERNLNDANGALTEVSVCSFIVGILQSDATGPIALSCPMDITSASNPVNYDAATPSGGTPPYSISYVPSGNNFAPGTTTVTATVADSNSQTATCTFDVSLPAIGTDTTDPTITCPPNEIVYTATSGQSATATYQSATADDNSGTATISYAPQSSGAVFTSGVTMITATAEDPSGNTAMCTFFVIVSQDVDNPTISCPVNQREIVTTSGQSAVVNYPAATEIDNSGSATITYSPPQTSPGSTFTFGVTTVTATATDLAGNTDTCMFTVSVELAIGTDTTNPTITCPPNEFVYTATSGQPATVTYPPATADDNSGTATITYAPQSSGAVFTSGVTMITATAADPSGNTAMCTFFIIVSQDVSNPTITCPANQREIVTTSGQSAVVNYPAATATDISGSPTITYSPPQTSPGSTFTFGETTVTATATDLAGNTNTCTFTVSVELGATTQLDGDLIGDGSCGVRTMPGVQSRIVGGTDAALGDHPWIGSLKTTGHTCGATLIRLDVAISAAHCFVFSQQQLNQGATPPTSVVFGEQRLDTTEPSEQSRTFTQVMPHPSYNPLSNNAEFDLVLLFLNNPVTITDFVRPMCLAFNSNEAGTYSNCIIAGWGDLAMNSNMGSNMLQQVSLPLITPESCALAPYFETSVTSNIICAGGGGGTDSCQGDSGGPMVCQSNQDSSFHLVGVVSVGTGCGQANNPGFYTRISQFRTWIENTITQVTSNQG